MITAVRVVVVLPKCFIDPINNSSGQLQVVNVLDFVAETVIHRSELIREWFSSFLHPSLPAAQQSHQ